MINFLYIHHSAIPQDDTKQFWKINEYHKSKWNFPSSMGYFGGYNYLCEQDGELRQYRAEGEEEATKMRAQTDKEAEIIQAEAYKKAEIISGEGDQKSVKIYAEAYGKDPELFEFLKSLETLKEILKEKTTLILSTDSKLLKYLEYRPDQLEKK